MYFDLTPLFQVEHVWHVPSTQSVKVQIRLHWASFLERFRSMTHPQQDEFIYRLETLREANLYLNSSEAFETSSISKLDDLGYLESVYRLLVYLIESIDDTSQLHALLTRANQCKLILLGGALEMHMKNLVATFPSERNLQNSWVELEGIFIDGSESSEDSTDDDSE